MECCNDLRNSLGGVIVQGAEEQTDCGADLLELVLHLLGDLAISTKVHKLHNHSLYKWRK
jgi:hypothetical protein